MVVGISLSGVSLGGTIISSFFILGGPIGVMIAAVWGRLKSAFIERWVVSYYG